MVGLTCYTVGRAGVEPALRAVRPVARQSGEPPKGPAAHRAFSWWVTWCSGLWQPSPGVPTSALPGHPLSRFTCRSLGSPVDTGTCLPGGVTREPGLEPEPRRALQRAAPRWARGTWAGRYGLASLSSPCSRGSDPRGSGSPVGPSSRRYREIYWVPRTLSRGTLTDGLAIWGCAGVAWS